MDIVNLAVDILMPYEKNPRRISKKAVDVVAASIREFGWKVPIVVDKNNIIVAGHTRLQAAKSLGMSEVPCIIADDLSPEQVRAFRLADNRVGEESKWDMSMLGKELEGIFDDEPNFDMSEFGFDYGGFGKFKFAFWDKIVGLNERYIISPFSVLDAKQGAWQERKKLWQQLIQDDGESRGCVIGEHFGVSVLDSVVCELMCKWYSPLQTENKMFDCFAGDTEFGYVASYIGNYFTGIELRQEQADFNALGTNEKATYICDDGRNICEHIEAESQDMFFSCPPYYDLEVYSDLPEDASNQGTYEEFYQIIDTALTESMKCLKNNRFAIVVCGDVRNRKTGEYYDFITDLKTTLKAAGLVLYNELILLDSIGTAGLRANKLFQRGRKNVKVHQNILVFYKGDTAQIRNEFYSLEGMLLNESENVESKDLDPGI